MRMSTVEIFTHPETWQNWREGEKRMGGTSKYLIERDNMGGSWDRERFEGI